MKTSLCRGWEFTPQWSEEFARFETPAQAVELPHNVRQLPLHCVDPADYQMIAGYRRHLEISPCASPKTRFLRFDGAAHIASVYVNGQLAAEHFCGYTAFTVDITDFVHEGDNTVALRLDTTENPAIPPFGFVVDYLTYGGLYREAWLIEKSADYISDVFVQTPTTDSALIEITTSDCKNALALEIEDPEGKIIWHTRTKKRAIQTDALDVRTWDCESPVLYTLRVHLLDGSENPIDTEEVKFGFRTAEFKADGFYLNGVKTFLRGLNRHQSFPYMGYAATERLQREDARILKEELQVNAVRTSHYPQSRYFIDECDKLGLLVFTEIPGWQHIGDEAWKNQAVKNTEEMVLQYRNHPSIILWGVRINESQDDNAFYKRTNKTAHVLDPSRATSGVRYLEKSNLLEDVYAFNDFSHTGHNAPVRPKGKVTGNRNPLLISEHNGHMFPTKSFDTWQRRQEHALRHARVLDGAMGSGGHSGSFGWCMFDYPTHKDFGSGDRVCYHGVMDAFRNPKTAAAVYASQGEGEPVLEVASSMDIGDYPGGQIGTVAVFSNADEVKLYKNDEFVCSLNRSSLENLPHPPFVMDDTIGCLLETKEGFEPKKAKRLHDALLSAGKYGLAGMPLKDKLLMAFCMVRYGMKFADGYALYGKYVGNWGGEATTWRFDAVKDGAVVKSVTRRPDVKLHIQLIPTATELHIGDSFDMSAVRVNLCDSLGNVVPYAQLPVRFTLTGDAELIGPETATAEGGMCGTYLRTTVPGRAVLTATADGAEPDRVIFTID